VDWQKADALQPESYADILPSITGVVHTLGTLLEDRQYKKAIAEGNIGTLIGHFLNGLVDSGNPLEKGQRESYEVLNRDSGL
jgi:flagellar motor component MotA